MFISGTDRCFVVAIVSALLVSCSCAPAPMAVIERVSSVQPSRIPTVARGRYTLIELRPELQQQDLQQQIINLRIPASASTTVGDAMRYVLRHSGYRLCEGDPALATLWALPLPAAHLQLGPLPLNQTLQLLAGSAWRLSVDERTRQVCFIDGEVQP